MRFIEQIRTRGHLYFLDKVRKDIKRVPQAINYSRANYVGILFDASEPGNIAVVKQYVKRLQNDGKKVEMLGFLKNKKQAEGSDFDYFTLSGVSLFHIPDKEVSAFANKPFDLLISLHTGTILPLEYISALSKAKCRVGRYIENKTWCYDMMVYAGEEKPLSELVKQTDYLLTEINKNATV